MSEDESNDGVGMKIHMSTDDYHIIVSWMEIPANFNAIYRKKSASELAYDEKKVTKLSAYGEMARHLHRHTRTKNFPLLTAHNMAQRWATYTKKFKATLHKSMVADGVSLSRRELKSGMSVQEKLEQLCPHFSRLKQLFADDILGAQEAASCRSDSTSPETFANADESEATRSGMQHEARAPDAESPSSVAENGREESSVELRTVSPARTKMTSAQKRRLGQLEQDDRRWQEEQAERERQRAHELALRNLDMAEKRAARRQELLLTLLAQGKSAREIETFFKLVEETTPTATLSSVTHDPHTANDAV
uniref:Uncharacterized protein n=1 Tax=Globisporangium ultimum (strain ATCC 200006 / CBS 805.95 / DAOM BR144) TaxID=431595 RepID=K3WL60_GLOUD